ncbi:rho GTPase-activating protein SYDE1 isoform X2 [Phaenicophaeus curvirostris]|uniref:rho GTPase-activating protein SYDE1 isoform X2 n=1 Tax=Phaenicophaeus curvirostris TaxID=33595 RepID=UPI0037F09E87
MAEPLLRRTISRLRGRGKKAAGKEGEHPDPPVTPEAEAAPAAPRKQNWARFSCGARDEKRSMPPKSSPEPSDTGQTDPDAGVSQPDNEASEAAEAASGSGELGGLGRSPRAGAYLQSLERSSRHWVLSAAKGPGLEDAGGRAEVESGAVGSEGDIWYNPIPEDEDPQPASPGRSWHGGSWEAERGRAGEAEGHGEEPGASGTQACGKSPSPPSSPRKSRSVPKLKSPGTVRRLSLKMKKLPELRRKLSLRSPRPRAHEGATSPSPSHKESSNVISRYHLDSSVSSRPRLPRAKAASKTGYLSDGDSPELPARGATRLGAEDGDAGLDLGAFRPYSCGEMVPPPRGGQLLSGLVNVHLHGVGELKAAPRGEAREVFCVLQVDGENRARTALLPCRTAFLGLNHTFNLELEGAQHLKVMMFSWDPSACRNRLCCHGTVVLPHVFRGCRAQQLAVRLQPRGVLYSKFSLVEQWDGPGEREPRVFGVELGQLVERERTATKVPLLIQKCVAEIEKRGLKVVGLYRLCGSAAVKKELRDAFERDSAAVTLSERLYPDINVITGILKDFLRELPTPLITSSLYHVVLEAMAKRPPRAEAPSATGLLACLPHVQKAFNRMTSQNLAVCFGPVLLTRAQEPRRSAPAAPGTPSPTEDGAVDFKKHIEVLHYLLQAWPAPPGSGPRLEEGPRRPPLRLDLLESSVVARARPRGPESPPSNRYAGDWSVCDHRLLPGSGPPGAGDPRAVAGGDGDLVVANVGLGEEEAEAPFGPRLNLKDFDALILDLERELAKQINVCL